MQRKDNDMPACQVVTAHRLFGSEACGVEATKKIGIPGGYQDEMYICDEHHSEYFGAFLEKEYAYYQILKEEGLETNDRGNNASKRRRSR